MTEENNDDLINEVVPTEIKEEVKTQNNDTIKIPLKDLKERKLFLAVPMYGGQCYGMFAKSVADLASLCTHYGIRLQMYFLFNESLITRARNYCADEFLRSDATHLMFIDSDIGFNPNDVLGLLGLQSDESEYDIIGAVYPKKSLDYKTKITTEDGIMSLGKIVNNKYNGKVLSYGKNGFEYKPIIAHHKTPANGKQWVKLVMTDRYGKIISTYDHEIATVEDVFDPKITYKYAINMKDMPVVRVPRELERNKTSNENVLFSSDQLSFLYGTLLGDSSVKKSGQLTCSHSSKAIEYAQLKVDLFSMKMNETTVTLGDKVHGALELYGHVNYQLKKLRELLYVDGKKTVRNIIDKLDIKSFAMLYMDDGFYAKSKKCGIFCTEAFSDTDLLLISNKLSEFGFKNSIDKTKRIRLSRSSTVEFFKAIEPYVISSMEYKLGEFVTGCEKFDWGGVKRLDYSVQPCLDVIRINDDMDQYDITVEDNFNFVTKGSLVHNCISWEKIKVAVDKGFADENPENLKNFVGDYVFNPKHGQTRIPLNRPVEVLEIGTGFMMIRRKTLEKFRDAFPQYNYKPDHVRTEHFDGTREIMQFFQSEIDPVSKRYLSEDYWFCQKIQELEMKTFMCPWMKLEHVGTMHFGGSLADIASVGVSATADPAKLKHKKKQV